LERVDQQPERPIPLEFKSRGSYDPQPGSLSFFAPPAEQMSFADPGLAFHDKDPAL
jgi:hypothetical protein